MSLEDSIERVRAALVKKMGGKSYLRPVGMVDALVSDTGESAITVRQAMGRLVKEGWLSGVAADGTPFGQVRIVGVLPVKPVDPDLQRWLAVLEESGITEEARKILSPLSVKLSDFETLEMRYILEGLVRLRDNIINETGEHLFIVSARYLLGSSKLLDTLNSPSLRAFGISVEKFQRHPLYVVVAGSSAPETVVLVENPAAFEMAVATHAMNRCAFIATFGFGLSKSQEDYGNQLAEMVKDRFDSAITLMREGSACPPAKELLNHPNITFWGDLDPAGIQIFLRLKKSLPLLKLSALYQPMIASLSDNDKSHPYVLPVGKQGQHNMVKPTLEIEPMASMLLELCASRGVDQEQVLPLEVELLASHPLRLDNN